MESLSLMPPGNAFQSDGATYLKACWLYRFVLESLGLEASRRDLEADQRARGGVEMKELREQTTISMNRTRLKFESWQVRIHFQNASQNHFYCFLKDIWILKSGCSLKSPTYEYLYCHWQKQSNSSLFLWCFHQSSLEELSGTHSQMYHLSTHHSSSAQCLEPEETWADLTKTENYWEECLLCTPWTKPWK